MGPEFSELHRTDPFEHLGLQPLGRANSEVWKVIHLNNRNVYARKEFSLQMYRDEHLIKRKEKIKDEISITKRSQHCHVVKYCGDHYVESTQMVGLLLQPVADMNLVEFFSQVERTKDMALCATMCRWSPCLFRALDYLHSIGIRHKDIKPSNIIIKGQEVYFSDFGISRDFCDEVTSKTAGPLGAITERYVAPEANNEQPRGRAADIWALGCTLLEICTVASGENSIRDLNEHLQQAGGGRLAPFCQSPYHVFDWIFLLLVSPGRDARLGEHIRKLLQLAFLMLDPDCDRRITAPQLVDLLDHPDSTYFHSIGQLACERCRNTPRKTVYCDSPHSIFQEALNGGIHIPSKDGLSVETEDLWEMVKRRWLASHIWW
ncbi:kinase-like protein [Hypomontagnella monticulosa]|nr:kinase-like protein [Hypomontagnella monticulosa]